MSKLPKIDIRPMGDPKDARMLVRYGVTLDVATVCHGFGQMLELEVVQHETIIGSVFCVYRGKRYVVPIAATNGNPIKSRIEMIEDPGSWVDTVTRMIMEMSREELAYFAVTTAWKRFPGEPE